MTRFNRDFFERVERDLTQISDQATPSSTAWEAIQHRIDKQDTTAPTMEVIMLDPDTNKLNKRPRTGLLVAASVAGLALVGGLVVVANRDNDTQPANEPDIPASIVPAPDPVAIEEDPDPEAQPETAAPDAEPAQDLPFVMNFAPPGRYTTDLLGIDASFDIPVGMLLETARTGEIVLFGNLEEDIGEPYAAENGLFLSATRISGWSTSDEAASFSGDAASIDPYDVDAWIADNDIIVASDATTEIAGRDSRVLELRFDPAADGGAPCVNTFGPCIFPHGIASNSVQSRKPNYTLSSQRNSRYYILTIEGSEPLIIEAAGPEGSDWLDVIDETFIATLELGADAPPTNWDRPPPEVAATGSGTFSDAGFESGGLGADGALPFTATTNFDGDIAGAATLTGRSVPTVVTDGNGAVGAADFAFEGTIDGLGEGTLALTDRFISAADGTWTSTATVFGGTGDFENAVGSVQFESSDGGSTGTYTYDITVLADAPEQPVSVTGTYIDSGLEAVVNDDGSVSYSVTTNFEGQMVGPAPSDGQQWPTLPEGTIGTTDFVFEGTIEGLGEGTLVFYDIWLEAPEVPSDSTVVITGGTGDFESAVGTATFVQGPVEGAPGSVGSYTFEIIVP
jgi:hypothetical protein